jgi:hypothetical protein
MAANSKITLILMLVLAVCGGIFGALIAVKFAQRMNVDGIGQVALVSLGAAVGFGVVMLFYWMGQNLFIEVSGEDKNSILKK